MCISQHSILILRKGEFVINNIRLQPVNVIVIIKPYQGNPPFKKGISVGLITDTSKMRNMVNLEYQNPAVIHQIISNVLKYKT